MDFPDFNLLFKNPNPFISCIKLPFSNHLFSRKYQPTIISEYSDEKTLLGQACVYYRSSVPIYSTQYPVHHTVVSNLILMCLADQFNLKLLPLWRTYLSLSNLLSKVAVVSSDQVVWFTLSVIWEIIFIVKWSMSSTFIYNVFI